MHPSILFTTISTFLTLALAQDTVTVTNTVSNPVTTTLTSLPGDASSSLESITFETEGISGTMTAFATDASSSASALVSSLVSSNTAAVSSAASSLSSAASSASASATGAANAFVPGMGFAGALLAIAAFL